MGLAERKAAKSFEETQFPQLEKQLAEVAGFKVPVKVDWASLCADGYADIYEEAWTKVYFTPLFQALESLTEDELGREFVQGSLKRLVIQNVAGNVSGSSFASFVDGVLTLDHEPCTNLDDIHDRREGIQRALQSEPELSRPDDPLAAFLDMKPRGLETTLQALLRIASRRQAGIPLLPPRVTVSLHSGTYFTGTVRDILEDSREGRSLLLQEERDREANAVIVNVNHIECVSVLDAGYLGFIRVDDAPIPSPLQLRRQLHKDSEKLGALLERPVPLALTPGSSATSAEALRALAFLATRVLEALGTLARDGEARRALHEKVQRIHLRADTTAGVSLSNGTLEFVTPLKPAGWRTSAELQQELPPIL
ncbi:hypothetical protein ACJ2CR_14490 [Myxococcus faecalis]|jgi:hypothetical protein|uniref:hypothetical protein n=1 Tax=Myxococcus TaxID=32 RepID=UPI001CC0A00C|nr:hypothetical protein [Myxococcus sp. XM-1-1-1]MBZ4411003.1 hypothetical protein [Myxococcus sp. XM-1-1-1]